MRSMIWSGVRVQVTRRAGGVSGRIWSYRRLSSSSVTRVVIEVWGKPASTWALTVAAAGYGQRAVEVTVEIVAGQKNRNFT